MIVQDELHLPIEKARLPHPDNLTEVFAAQRRLSALCDANFNTTTDRLGTTISPLCYLEFGVDAEPSIGNHLVLFESPDRPLMALKWELGAHRFTIPFIQRLPGADLSSVKKRTGVHPSEVLVSECVARLKPVLQVFNDLPVIFEGHFAGPNAAPIRDRFFSRKGWRLDPKKQRVADLLGEALVSKMVDQ